jgi:hypothetical protein
MSNITYGIQLRQAEKGYEALVPHLNVSATGATIDDAVNNVLQEVSRAMEAKTRAEMAQKCRKRTVA